MGLFDELKNENEDYVKNLDIACGATKKTGEPFNEDHSQRNHFIKKHRIFQSTQINKVFTEAVENLKNNSRILEPNDVVSDKLLPVSGCHIEYKNLTYLVKVEADPYTEKVHLTVTIGIKEIGNGTYQIDGFNEKVMADDITKIIKGFTP